MGEIIHLGIKQEGSMLVVSSRIVAENFDKRHDNVIRDIEELIGGLLKIEETQAEKYFIQSTYIHPQNNQAYKEYLLTKDGFTLLTMGWTGEKAMRFKVAYINEFNRMEQELKNNLPADPRKLLAAAVLEANKIIQEQDKKIQELLPKAEFYDAVAGSKDAIDIGSAAKVLDMGIGRNKLFEILRNKGVLMSNNIPYQKYIDCGYFRTIEQKYSKPDGTVCINIKTLVYQKGLDFIRKLLKEDNVVALRRVSKEQTA
ncbi:hypothetical protein D2962_09625 [Biomaibacter acetigenes]|uniref:Antirepressor protein C-terminal domain-containing protein n=1 Tax=Biomaibacter acetigenes TaxID=2316383 RepID=A0A3G2R5Z7_9FIRM|nr:phage regulatory protein/antirepressor Ant [Biomaibacter acetigenes]AYO30839.1 hypothetical protein D2962_09625 [Biomaibacter acetigenes]